MLRLPSIRHENAVLCGDDDPVTSHVNHRVMARLIPSAPLHTVQGGGISSCSIARTRSAR